MGSSGGDRRRGALFRILRQSGGNRRRAFDPAWRRLSRFHHLRAVRRFGPDHSLELPAGNDRARHLCGVGHSQCLCGENARVGPDQQHLVSAGGRGRRPAERRAEHPVRTWSRGRSGPVVTSGYRQYRLHRIGGNRHSRGHRGGGECEAGDPRAWRQVRRHYHAGCRSRRGDGFGSLGHLFQRRTGLFGDVAGDRA